MMTSRRSFVVGGALALTTGSSGIARAAARISGGLESVPPGTIVISQSQRRLFLTQYDGTAISYPIAIGKSGKA